MTARLLVSLSSLDAVGRFDRRLAAPRLATNIDRAAERNMLLEDSPSLRREVASIIAKMLPKARELAQLSLE
jgi:hypothetical protein